MQQQVFFLLIYVNKFNFDFKIFIFIVVFRNLFSPDDLILHGDVGFGAEQQFENEARMALRLANFLSAFLQVLFKKNIRECYVWLTSYLFAGRRFHGSFFW